MSWFHPYVVVVKKVNGDKDDLPLITVVSLANNLGVISNEIWIFTRNNFFSFQFLETIESDLHILSSDLTH